MKKFFKFGKEKKGHTPEPSPQPSRASLGASGSDLSEAGGYIVKEKDLPKLHKASWTGDLSKVKQLAKKDASPFDKEFRTPLHLACARGHSLIAEELLQWKAKVNVKDNEGKTPLHKAVECEHAMCAKHLINYNADPNIMDKEGNAAIHYAARVGNEGMLLTLLEPERTDIDKTNAKNESPLHLAVTKNKQEAVKCLLEEGCNPDIQDADGRTPLMIACQNGRLAITKLLISSEADTQLRDQKGWTADDIAIMASQDKCREVIQAYNAQNPQSPRSDVTSPDSQPTSARQQEPGLGAPALEAPDPLSDVENTGSKASDHAGAMGAAAAGGDAVLSVADSWNDSEDTDADDDALKKKPSLLKQKEEFKTEKASSPAPSQPISSLAPAAAAPPEPPMSARSNMSAISVGEGVKSEWSDNDEDSLFSNPDKKGKVSVVRQMQVTQEEEEVLELKDEDSWADDPDSYALPGSKPNPPTSKLAASDKPASAADGSQGFGTYTQEQKQNNQTKTEIIQDLGLNDVSDVSDPDLSDGGEAVKPFSPPKLSSFQKPAAKPSQSKDFLGPNLSVESDWGDSTDADVTPRAPKLVSAREIAKDEPKPINTRAVSQPPKDEVLEDEKWDSESSVDTPRENTNNAAAPQENTNNAAGTSNKAPSASSGQHKPTVPSPLTQDDEWDSDIELEVLPDEPPKSTSVREEVREVTNVSTFKTTTTVSQPKKNNIFDDDDEDDKWDTESDVTTPRSDKNKDTDKDTKDDTDGPPPPPLPASQPPPSPSKSPKTSKSAAPAADSAKKTSAMMYLDSDMDSDSEEEESEWEKERKKKKDKFQAEADKLKQEKEQKEAEAEKKKKEAEKKKEEEKKKAAEKDAKQSAREELGASPRPAPAGGIMYDDHDDDDDTFNDIATVPGMESPRKPEPTLPSSVIQAPRPKQSPPPPPVRTTPYSGPSKKPKAGHAETADDCLSYSSTEHDMSDDDDLPPSGGASAGGGLFSSGAGGAGRTSGRASPAHNTLSLGSDQANVMRLQEQLREGQRRVEKERSAKTTLENKRKNLEREKSELIEKLEEVTRAKSTLEKSKIESEAKIRNLQFQLTEEAERRNNSELLYNKTKDQLQRKEDQYTAEIDARQKLELNMRNIQMELRSALSNAKQLEEEKEDLLRQIERQKNQRQLQEKINEEQLVFQKTLNLTQGTDREKFSKDLSDTIANLDSSDAANKTVNADGQAQLYQLRMELERLRQRNKDDHELLTAENEELTAKIDELKAEIQLNEQALTHASLRHNVEITEMTSANSKMAASHDRETAAREKAESELESLRARLESTQVELDRTAAARSELERMLQNDKEEWTRQCERRDREIDSLQNTVTALQQQVSEVNSKISRADNELHIANATLLERTNQLHTLQKELEQRRSNQESMDGNLRKQAEDAARHQAQAEAMAEKIAGLQHDNVELKQQLEDSRSIGKGGDETFNNILTNMRGDNEKAVNTLQDKNQILNETVIRIKEELHQTSMQRDKIQAELQIATRELTEAQKRQTIAEAGGELNSKAKEQAETERRHLQSELERMTSRLEDTRDKLSEAQALTRQHSERADRAEAASHLAQATLSAQRGDMGDLNRSKGVTAHEERIHHMEIERTKLMAELAHKQDNNEQLQRQLEDANMAANAQQQQAGHEAKDAQQLWESEVKSRSKLGLRIAQLEREKTEADTAREEERRKTRKALELKKAAEMKYDKEVEKTHHFQKEVSTLRLHLKAAKKRLKESEPAQNQINSLQQTFEMERQEMERALANVKKQNSSMDPADTDQLKAEMEAKARQELNQKLEEVNAYLETQARARQRIDTLRDHNEQQLRSECDRTRKELMEEMSRLRESYQMSLSAKENHESEKHRLQQLYENELQLKEKLVSRLEHANERAAQASLNIERQRFNQSTMPLSPHHLNNTMTAAHQTHGASFTGYTPLTKSMLGHGVNDLSEKLKQELDRSINRHLEKGPHISINPPSPRFTPTDSTAMSSNFNKASQEYLTLLQKNYLL